MDLTSLIEPLVVLSRKAGDAILEVYATDFDVQEKADDSPLTKADMASNKVIVEELRKLAPDIPIISEEFGLPEFEERGQWKRYWLIDPLDGTKEFVKRNGEFTVNIALIDGHKPVLGIVHVPVSGVTYTGCEGQGASKRHGDEAPVTIEVARDSDNPVKVVGSRSHSGANLDHFFDALGETELVPMGSSLKFCVVAEGKAHVYPRLGLTSEWDTAAAQAVVEQAGGAVLELDGTPLRYNAKTDILNPFFVVRGPDDRDWVELLEEQ